MTAHKIVDHFENNSIDDRSVRYVSEMIPVKSSIFSQHKMSKTDKAYTYFHQAIHSEMITYFEQGDLLKMSDLNAQLHEEILKMAPHQTVAELIHRLRAQHVRFQYRTILVPGRACQSLDEHGAMIDAIAKADEDAVERAMRTHLAHVVDALHCSINQGCNYSKH